MKNFIDNELRRSGIIIAKWCNVLVINPEGVTLPKFLMNN